MTRGKTARPARQELAACTPEQLETLDRENQLAAYRLHLALLNVSWASIPEMSIYAPAWFGGTGLTKAVLCEVVPNPEMEAALAVMGVER